VIVDLIVVQDLNLAFRNIYWTVVENLKLAFGIYESFVLAFARTFDGCSFLFVWRHINPVRCHNSNSTTKKTQHTHPSLSLSPLDHEAAFIVTATEHQSTWQNLAHSVMIGTFGLARWHWQRLKQSSVGKYY
jgi:hypothetical protein